MKKEELYNSWTNYETWNVASWIQNDKVFYIMAKQFKTLGYKRFVLAINEFGHGFDIAFKTPDNVAWNDAALDIEALDNMMKDL